MSEDDFGPPMDPDLFSLGFKVGGPTPKNELLGEAFRGLMKAVMQRRGEYSNDGLRINLVFQIPGPISQPDFEGVFPARFARKNNHLLVNAAVPPSVTHENVRDYFAQALKETKAAASDYLQKRKIAVETISVMAMIDDLVADSAAP